MKSPLEIHASDPSFGPIRVFCVFSGCLAFSTQALSVKSLPIRGGIVPFRQTQKEAP